MEDGIFLLKRGLCASCGLMAADDHFPSTNSDGKKLFCCPKPIADVKCTNNKCNIAAALCRDKNHLPNNASQVLLDWLKSNNIKSTVTTIVVNPAFSKCSHKESKSIPPTSVELSPKVRKQLQMGNLSCFFDNQQMVELFKKDLVKKGHSNPDIKPRVKCKV